MICDNSSSEPTRTYVENLELVPTCEEPIVSTPQYLARIIFLSYRFSQGGIGTQNRMLQYIEETHQPDLFALNTIEEVRVQTLGMVSSYFLNEKLHPATAIPWEHEAPDSFVKTRQLVENEIAGLFERFLNRSLIEGFDTSPVSIAQSVITMDADYLTRNEGRAGSVTELKTRVGEYNRDKFESQIIKYGFLSKSTGMKEFDEIFSAISTEEIVRQLDEFAIKRLKIVLDIFLKKHPEELENPKLNFILSICEGMLNGE